MNESHEQQFWEIRVRGRLADCWLKRFEGMRFEYREGDTHIVGPVLDQAALEGMLQTVSDLGLALKGVNLLDTGGL